jgi:hypothetical protein
MTSDTAFECMLVSRDPRWWADRANAKQPLGLHDCLARHDRKSSGEATDGSRLYLFQDLTMSEIGVAVGVGRVPYLADSYPSPSRIYGKR